MVTRKAAPTTPTIERGEPVDIEATASFPSPEEAPTLGTELLARVQALTGEEEINFSSREEEGSESSEASTESSGASTSTMLTTIAPPPIRGGQQATYTNEKGTQIPCVVMGNLGQNPDNMLDLATRQIEPEQLRSIGLTALSLKKESPPEFKAEQKLEWSGSVQFQYWKEDMQRVFIRFGWCIIMLFIRVIESGDVKHYNIFTERNKITTKMVEDHCTYYGECPFGKRVLEDAAQFTLQAIGPNLKCEVLSGASTNQPGTKFLWRIISLFSPDDVTLIDTVRKELEKLKLENDPTINIREYWTKVQSISVDLVTVDANAYKQNMFGKTFVLNLKGSPAWFRDHMPDHVHPDIHPMVKKHTSEKTDYTELAEDMEKLCIEYDRLLKQGLWHPVSNAAKTKEVSLLTKLANKLNTIEQKLGNGNSNGNGSSGNLAPKMSENGKIKLEAGKKYSSEEFSSLSKADKDYLNKLRSQSKSSGGGGGNNSNSGNNNNGEKKEKPKIVPITNKDAPNTPTGCRDGVDAEGKPTGKKEWYCSKCKWNYGHGDSHPTKKHDDNFVPKWKKKKSKSAGSTSLSISTILPAKPKSITFAPDTKPGKTADAEEAEAEAPKPTEDVGDVPEDAAEDMPMNSSFLLGWSTLMLHPKAGGNQE